MKHLSRFLLATTFLSSLLGCAVAPVPLTVAYTPPDTPPAIEARLSGVMRYAFDGGFCTSVVVSDTTLLTARHCTDDQGDKPGIVFNVNGDVESVKPLAVALGLDVAVLQAGGSFPSSYITPESDERASFGTVAYIAGYGCSEGRHIEVRPLTKVANIDGAFGQDRYEEWRGLVCPGDSGSPLFNRYGELIGIASAKGVSESLAGIGLFVPVAE